MIVVLLIYHRLIHSIFFFWGGILLVSLVLLGPNRGAIGTAQCCLRCFPKIDYVYELALRLARTVDNHPSMLDDAEWQQATLYRIAHAPPAVDFSPTLMNLPFEWLPSSDRRRSCGS